MVKMVNFTNITDANNLFELTKGLDTIFPTAWSDTLGLTFVILTFAVSFIAMKSAGNYDTSSCFASSMFIATVVAVLSAVLGLMSFEKTIMVVVLLAISVVVLFASKR